MSKLRWGVVCKNYVSIHRDEAAATRHKEALDRVTGVVGACREPHDVQLTELKSGSRLRGDYSA